MMNQIFYSLLFLAVIIMNQPVLSQNASGSNDTIFVSATRIETPGNQIGSSVSNVSGSEIEMRKKTRVVDVLRSLPALDVVEQGSPGGASSVFIRGAKSEHTVILIDGVEWNNPITPGRSFNFNNLMIENIERIEVLRGPQSTLYGSDAIGGVINIITRKGEGDLESSFSVEGGSFNTWHVKASAGGSQGPVSYSLGLGSLNTDGISAADEEEGNREEDGYQNTSVSARLGFLASETLDFDFVLRWVESEADNDNFGGVFGDDPNNELLTEQLATRIAVNALLWEDQWTMTLGVSLADHEQENLNPPDADHPNSRTESLFEGTITRLEWLNHLDLGEQHTLTLGLETEEEEGDSESVSDTLFGTFISIFDEQSARTDSFLIQDQIQIGDSWFSTLGLRMDDHDTFGSETTYRLTSTYFFEESQTQVKGSMGTGFKSPSLFQLYSAFGNRTLDPEESLGWDLGIEQTLMEEQLVLGATWFANDFDNMIDFDSASFLYFNILEAKSQGLEIEADWVVTEQVTLGAQMTFTDTEDKSTGEDLVRRAELKSSVNMHWQMNEQVSLYMEGLFVGERKDWNFSVFPARLIDLDAYSLVNVAVSWDCNEHLQVFGRIDNLLDEDYQEVLGYGTAGVGGYLGLKIVS